MKLLVDTHVFLWLAAGRADLPRETIASLQDPRNAVFFSAVSAWEMAIKQALGKLVIPDGVAAEAARFRFAELPVTVGHALAVRELPLFHSDPFDRLLIAQATVEGLRIVTRDGSFAQYGVPVLPA